MNPHDVLGIRRDASEKEIKAAYRKMVLETHPDRNPGDTQAAEKFKRVQEAYDKLTNPDQQFGNVPFGFSDVFDSWFSFSGKQRKERGRDIHADCVIDFMEAANGCKSQVKLRRGEVCPTCNGSCAAPNGIESCHMCQGQGTIVFKQGNITIRTTCNYCGGKGSSITSPCEECGGDGLIKDTVTVTIDIPAGIKNGDCIRLPRQGEQKGIPGDAIVRMKVNPHPLFHRFNDDLKFILPISFTDAVFGTTVEVPTLTESKVLIIPPGSKSGDEHRLSGKGLLNLQTGRAGDCVVVLEIDTTMPENDKTLKCLHKLRELEQKEETPLRAEYKEKIKQTLRT